ncbi:PQ loop repeat-domain-containing protein [Umbelopsis sp. AD052]|nr:PQ loop repeat-domain-containing protein [Umbelopsis sp. AD052]
MSDNLVNDHLAELFGYISIACWVVVLTPQIYLNYRNKTGDGISFNFLLLWLIGDIMNILGIILQKLMFTVFLLGVYYILSDAIIVLQVLYYRKTSSYHPLNDHGEMLSDAYGSTSSPADNDATMFEMIKCENKQKRVVRRIAAFWVATATFITGSIFCVIWSLWPTGSPTDVDLSQLKLIPQLLGWTSASFYIFSRIPQILKTYRDESVEGLSIGMFVFSVVGNITFAISIVLKSQDPTYIAINMPWLYGSAGTLFFDFTIFLQFHLYRGPETILA